MPLIGYHASHEQLPPAVLLEAVQRAEAAGFDAAMCSDHLAPWTRDQRESGFAWSWLGAALATTSLPFGVVTAPGQRYHPVILAQAIGTLASMFPDRFWAALGSGENLNEHITGHPWPPKAARNDRLLASVEVIRGLLAGREVSVDGAVRVDRARVWSLPPEPPALIGAATTPGTARIAAGWADGLITVGLATDGLRRVVDAYREHGGRGPVALQLHLSWAPDEDDALHTAWRQWRNGLVTPPECWDLDTPDAFERAADAHPIEDIRSAVLVSSSLAEHVDRIGALIDIGFDQVYLHGVGPDQRAFIDTFGAEVVPLLKGVGA